MLSGIKNKKVSEVSVVVRNLEEAMKRYWKILGLGPWEIYTFDGVKIALMKGLWGLYDFELMEPLEGPSKEFLERKGEGVHHICLIYDSPEEIEKDVAEFEKKGIEILKRSNWGGGLFI